MKRETPIPKAITAYDCTFKNPILFSYFHVLQCNDWGIQYVTMNTAKCVCLLKR